MTPESEKALAIIRKYVPKFCVKRKADTWHQKLIGWLMKFNKSYMTNFYTTFGYTTYIPLGSDGAPWEWEVLCHEGRHGFQAKLFTRPLFALLYAIPAIFALGFLGFGLFWSWWWGLGALFMLLPLPAIFRAMFEFDAFCVTMAVAYWENSEQVNDWFIDTHMIPHFTGPNYYFMWPFKKALKYAFNAFKKDLESGAVLKDPYLADIHELCQELHAKAE